MKTSKAVIYQRVSTVDKQNNDRQYADITNYCIKEKITIIKSFEEKISGKIRTRPELTKLINYVNSHSTTIDYVIFSELSRLGRSTVGVISFIEALNKIGICSVFLKDNKKTLKEDGSIDTDTMMLLTFISAIDAREVESLSYRVKSGLKNSAAKGNITGGVYPYGYNKISDTNKQMVIQPDEAKVVNTIFEMALQNNSTISIARYLNSKNILPRKGKKWSTTTIYQMLKNELYIGKRRHNNEIFKCPAIISAETLSKSIENLKNRSSMGGGTLAHDYLLNNRKLVCGICGRWYNPQLKPNSKYSYYKCGSTSNQNEKCGNHGIEINFVEDVVSNVITKKFPNMITKNINTDTFDNDITKLKTDIKDYTEYLKKEKKKEDSLIDLKIDGDISKEQFKVKVEPVRNEINNLEAKIKTLEADLKRIEELKESKLNIKKILQNWKLNGVDKTALKKIIDKVVIYRATEQELNPNDYSIEMTEDDGTPILDLNNNVFENKFSIKKTSVIYKLEIFVYGLSITVFCSSFNDFYLCQGKYFNYK